MVVTFDGISVMSMSLIISGLYLIGDIVYSGIKVLESESESLEPSIEIVSDVVVVAFDGVTVVGVGLIISGLNFVGNVVHN